MSQATLQPRAQLRGDALTFSLDRLSQALEADVPGHERQWAQRVEVALVRVEAALRQHRASAEDPDGLLAEVDQTRPTLARQADGLRSEHEDFLTQVAALREQTHRGADAFQPAPHCTAAGIVEFGAIRHRAERFLAKFQEHKDAETKLVLDSINTDIGVGD